jgi:hypothetical protein
VWRYLIEFKKHMHAVKTKFLTRTENIFSSGKHTHTHICIYIDSLACKRIKTNRRGESFAEKIDHCYFFCFVSANQVEIVQVREKKLQHNWFV